ncbi:MAG TPA: DUF924 family protein [Stellaceae bacterium]|nr:DUF924 family protein [Stellaceae bacterium]
MTAGDKLPERAASLIDFWFGPPGDPEREAHRPIWFKSTPEHDERLRNLFLADYERAEAGALTAWEQAPYSALALLLLLDQLPRNLFRDTPRAYATDAMARAAADRALARGFEAAVPPVWRLFFYMPFHHSEELADQRRAVELFATLPERDHRGALGRYGMRYVEVIERFGRFPHRNAILGRPSSAEEEAFLAERRKPS